MSALVFANKFSGAKLAGDIYRGSVFHELHKRGITHEIVHCHDELGVIRSERVQRLMQSRAWGLMAVIGGDGTVNETVNAMADAGIAGKTPLLVFPAGKMNSLASSVGMSSVDAALETLKAFPSSLRTTTMPLWQLTEPLKGRTTYFHGYYGIGYHANVVRDAARLEAWWAGFSLLPRLYSPHLYTFARQLALAKSARMKVWYESAQGVDMELSGEYCYIHATQLKLNGVRNIVSPRAGLDGSNMLWVTLAPSMGRKRMREFARLAPLGKHVDMEGVRYFAAKSLSIEVQAPDPEGGEVGDTAAMLDGFPLYPAESMGIVTLKLSPLKVQVVCPVNN